MGIYRRTFQYFAPFWWQSLLGVLFSLGSIGFSLLKPWPLKFLIDGILQPPEMAGAEEARAFLAHWFGAAVSSQILWLCLAVVLIALFGGILNLISNYLFLRTGLHCLMKLRTELYAALQTLPLKFHDANRSSDSAFRVAYDSQSIQTIYNKGFATVFQSLVTLFWAVAVMLWIDWKLTLAAIAVLPFVFWAIRFFAERVRRHSTSIQEKESDLLTIAQEGLSAVRMVQAFGRENYEVRQFRRRAMRSYEANMSLNMISVSSALIITTLMAVGTAVLYGFGALQVSGGGLPLGDLIVFITYLAMLYQPLEQLSYTAWALEGAAAGMQRCYEVLDRVNDVPEKPGAKKLGTVRGEIAFRNVSFSYDGERDVLRDIDLDVSPGETIAVVGGTGNGKSTLLSLIPRFYDPTKGSVFVDGCDLCDLTKKSLRAQISVVLQDTVLFSTSIRENIAYGRPGASAAEIEEAARKAQAWDFIKDLPAGLESQVGERGSQLSVGQRQRIGIARAFLKDAPILLLDEPTSALDQTTERAIMDALSLLMAGRTTLMVTHRLGTIHHFQRILVLDGGRIAEEGSGRELLEQQGIYAKLIQSSNRTDDKKDSDL